ncbi:MAG TPA: peptidoglycan-binding domain-containing protein [Verrucomicrobiae bacterium]|nr:peptidoglycan-binding domain-containing protein [Verrucomicrobiae bacterium]
MSKRYLLAGASALMLALAMPMPSMAQTSTVMTMPYSVAAVQRALNDLGYSAGPVDGLMGGKTRAAIRAYQIDNNLPVSGEPSRTLYDHIQRTLTARVNPAPAPSVDSSSVVEIQTRLRDRGYNIAAINGTLDSSTTAAIRAFQGDAGMPVNGIANAALLDQLRVGSTATSRALTRAEVVRLQQALAERGYDTGPADGVIGPKVRGAIRTYQADASMPVTGEATRTLLTSLESDIGDDNDDEDTGTANNDVGTSRLLQIEGELQRHGYYVGEFDGVADDQLRTAIRAYQTDAGLPVTGQANAALLDSLNSSTVRNRSFNDSLLVWEVENQLDRLGYAVGNIDGNLDEQTRRAIQVYKTKAGLPRDGQLTFALQDHLERNNIRNDTETASKLIWQIETELTRRGYKPGPVDGTMDQQTAAAIRSYEDDAGIAVTGKASQALLENLEYSNARNVTERDIREIERRLNRRGYQVGSVDGVVDSTTTAAIKSYQADAGLAVTGRPSLALRDHLRSSSTVSSNYVSPGLTVEQMINELRQATE